jgi:hypothetical protein
MLVQLSFGPSGGDVAPGQSYVCPRAHGHKAWFVTDLALCDYTRVGPFCKDSQHVLGGPYLYAHVHSFAAGPHSFADGWPSVLSASVVLGHHSDFLAGVRVSLGCL